MQLSAQRNGTFLDSEEGPFESENLLNTGQASEARSLHALAVAFRQRHDPVHQSRVPQCLRPAQHSNNMRAPLRIPYLHLCLLTITHIHDVYRAKRIDHRSFTVRFA